MSEPWHPRYEFRPLDKFAFSRKHFSFFFFFFFLFSFNALVFTSVALVYGVAQLFNLLKQHEPFGHHSLYLALLWALPGFLIGVLGWGLDEQSARPAAKSPRQPRSPRTKKAQDNDDDEDAGDDYSPIVVKRRGRSPASAKAKKTTASPSPRGRSRSRK